MPARSYNKKPRQDLILQLQALYFESLSRATNLTEQERERLQRDLRYARAKHHFWELGLGGRRPRVTRILYLPATLAGVGSVLIVKSPGEQLPDKPSGGALDLIGYNLLHDPATLVLAINPSARESTILSTVKKHVQAIKSRSGKTRASGGGRKRAINRMAEALTSYDAHHRRRNPLSAHELGELARTFHPITTGKKGRAEEYFTHEDRGNKLLQLAKHMIETARKGSSAWVAAFPCSAKDSLP